MTRRARRVAGGGPSPAGAGARLVAVALLAAALTSCSEGESDLPTFQDGGATAGSSPAASATANPGATAGSTSDPVRVTLAAGSTQGSEKVLVGLQGYVSDLARAMAEPADPPKSRWATPSGQSIIDQRAQQLRKAKRSTTGPITVSARIRLNDSRASVTGCLDQSKVQSRDAKGKRVPLEEPERLEIQALLTGGGESWRVQSFSVPGDAC